MKINNSLNLLTIFAKGSILDVRLVIVTPLWGRALLPHRIPLPPNPPPPPQSPRMNRGTEDRNTNRIKWFKRKKYF